MGICSAAKPGESASASTTAQLSGLSPLTTRSSNVEECPDSDDTTPVCTMELPTPPYFQMLPIFAMVLFMMSSVAMACFLFTRHRLRSMMQRQHSAQQRIDLENDTRFSLFRALQLSVQGSEDPRRSSQLSDSELEAVLSTLPLVNDERQKAQQDAATADEEKEENSEDADRSCSICLDDIGIGDKHYELQCSHLFHSECLAKWLKHGSNGCPICRRSVYDPAVLTPGGGGSGASVVAIQNDNQSVGDEQSPDRVLVVV